MRPAALKCDPADSPVSRWFGLILLPLVSFAADGVVAVVWKLSPLLVLSHSRSWTGLLPANLLAAFLGKTSGSFGTSEGSFNRFEYPVLPLLDAILYSLVLVGQQTPSHALRYVLQFAKGPHTKALSTQISTKLQSSSVARSWSTTSLRTPRPTGYVEFTLVNHFTN